MSPDEEIKIDVTALPPIAISVSIQPALNVALWQNHVPVLTELRLAGQHDGVPEDISLDLSCDPPVIRPRTWYVQGIAKGQLRALDDLDVELDGSLLAELTESTRATATFTARKRGESEALAEHRCDIRVLTRNEWGGSAGIPDILAAFVEPNDPAVATLLRLTSDQLRAAGRPDALEGYQTANKTRVWEQVEALWRAVASLDLRYVNPPPSFEQVGQKIRPPSQVISERLATCLDLAALFSSAIEAIGLRPVIVVVRDHAFAGFWLTNHDFGTSVADDPPGLRTRLGLQDLILFETTLVCGRERAGFKRACEAGTAHVGPDKDDAFEAVIDIHRARQRRIRPLSSDQAGIARRPEGPRVAEVGVALPYEQAPPLREDPDEAAEPLPTTPEGRLERWRKRLLDLSGRNRLLNLPSGSRHELAIDCPDQVRLIHMLADTVGAGRIAPLRFRPWPDLMSGNDPRSAKIYGGRLREEADRVFALQALEQREILVDQVDAALQTSLTEIFRNTRAAQQEGGANTLFLTIGSLFYSPQGKDRRYRAPIILVPVALERPSVRSGFSLRALDDETVVNPTLLEMLKQEFDLRIPALDGDRLPILEDTIDVVGILDAFRAKLREIPGWEVAETASLTNLSFTKYLMWKDLGDRAGQLHESELARRLLEGGTTESRGRASAAPGVAADQAAPLDDDVPPELVCPLNADSSQLRAVAAARRGESFILVGPPGTGKSQTITNIIADTISQGRTVLFVAEKRAALEVVQRQLARIKLSDFCLDLFSPKSSKALVVEQLDRAQQASDDFDPQEWRTASQEAAGLRDELNTYVRELHHRGRNGWTPFRAMGIVLRAESGGVPNIVLNWPDAEAHEPVDYQRLVELVEDAAAVLVRVGDITAAAAMSGVETSEWSPPWQGRLLDAARNMSARLHALAVAAQAARRALSLDAADLSWPALTALQGLADVLLDPTARNAGWTLREGADAVEESLRAQGVRTVRYAGVRSELATGWHPSVMSLPLADMKAEWTASTKRWFVPRALAHRRLRRRMAACCDAIPAELGADLGRLVEMQDIERQVVRDGERISPTLGMLWNGLDTNFGSLATHAVWAGRFRAATAACVTDAAEAVALRERLRHVVCEAPDLLLPEAPIGGALAALHAAGRETEAAAAALAPLCGSDPGAMVDPARSDWSAALAARLDGWTAAARHLRDWCAWRGIVQRAEGLGVGAMLRAMEGGLVTPSDAVRVFEANYARWWIGLAVDRSPRLKAFVAAQHEKQIERFRDQQPSDVSPHA